MRTEPEVSVPRATSAEPWHKDTPAPELEPPGTRWTAASHGLRGVGQLLLSPIAPKANSTVCVLPMTAAPASSRQATSGPGACQLAGSSRLQPAKIGTPGTP